MKCWTCRDTEKEQVNLLSNTVIMIYIVKVLIVSFTAKLTIGVGPVFVRKTQRSGMMCGKYSGRIYLRNISHLGMLWDHSMETVSYPTQYP